MAQKKVSPISFWSWPVVAMSCLGASLIIGALAPVQPSQSDDQVNMLKIDGIEFVSYSAVTEVKRPVPRIATEYSEADFLSSYRFWSDEMVIGSYESFWQEAQELKLQNRGKISERSQSLYEARFGALWTIISERGLAMRVGSPEEHVIVSFLKSDAMNLAAR